MRFRSRLHCCLNLEISNEAERDDVLVQIRVLNMLENVEHLFFSRLVRPCPLFQIVMFPLYLEIQQAIVAFEGR